MGDFIVTFEYMRAMTTAQTPDHEQWTFDDLKGGFWIMGDGDFRLCRESQGRVWIPPSCLRKIERV